MAQTSWNASPLNFGKFWKQELCPASCVRPCESDQGWMCEAGRS
jgi:hypothetical protein